MPSVLMDDTGQKQEKKLSKPLDMCVILKILVSIKYEFFKDSPRVTNAYSRSPVNSSFKESTRSLLAI